MVVSINVAKVRRVAAWAEVPPVNRQYPHASGRDARTTRRRRWAASFGSSSITTFIVYHAPVARLRVALLTAFGTS